MEEKTAEKVITTAAAIAATMDGAWSAEDGGWNNGTDAYLCGPNGERVHIMVGRYGVGEGRAEISGALSRELYQEMPYNAKLPSITVSLSKSAEQIGRDIERRLLPKYQEILATVSERKSRTDQAETGRQALAAQIATAFGTNGYGDFRRGKLHLGKYGDPLSGDVDFRYGGSEVEFSLRVSGELAVELAEAIAAIRS